MSLKRSHSGGRTFGGAGGEAGGKVDRQELFDELKRLSATGDPFSPVDVALSIGAGEPLVSKALLGLAAEGYLDRAEAGHYRSTPMSDISQAEFVKAYARASKVDSTRQRDLSEIGRLKQNNDTMRQRLLAAIAERDHYLGALRARGIDPGPVPAAASSATTTMPAPTSERPAPAVNARAESRGAPPETPAPEAAGPESSSEPGPAGMTVPSPESEHPPSGPGDAGGAAT